MVPAFIFQKVILVLSHKRSPEHHSSCRWLHLNCTVFHLENVTSEFKRASSGLCQEVFFKTSGALCSPPPNMVGLITDASKPLPPKHQITSPFHRWLPSLVSWPRLFTERYHIPRCSVKWVGVGVTSPVNKQVWEMQELAGPPLDIEWASPSGVSEKSLAWPRNCVFHSWLDNGCLSSGTSGLYNLKK